MANQKERNKPFEKAKLVKEKSIFHSELLERVNIGKALPLMEAPVYHTPEAYAGYGYVRRRTRTELTEEQETWLSEFRQWTDYNSAITKASI